MRYLELIGVATYFCWVVALILDLGVFVTVDQFSGESFLETLTLLTQPLLRAPPSFHQPSETVTEVDSDPWTWTESKGRLGLPMDLCGRASFLAMAGLE